MDRFLLIDANVARSCTEPARHETSQSCLKLTQILSDKNCPVGIALTPDLRSEWLRHASPMFNKWWASMESRRRVRLEEDKRVGDYRRHLADLDDENIKMAMDKDAHLVEASLLRHYPIASQDDKQRRYVSALAKDYPLAAKVQWFNPIDSSGWDEWVKGGCQDEELYRCDNSDSEAS